MNTSKISQLVSHIKTWNWEGGMVVSLVVLMGFLSRYDMDISTVFFAFGVFGIPAGILFAYATR